MRTAALALAATLAAVSCTGGDGGALPTPLPTTFFLGTPPSPSPTPSWVPAAVDPRRLAGVCANDDEVPPEWIRRLVTRTLGAGALRLVPVRSGDTSNGGGICHLAPPRRTTPYGEIRLGMPAYLSYYGHANAPTRVDERWLPGGAYSYTEGDAASVLLVVKGHGELHVTVGGLGERNRAAALSLTREFLSALAQA